LTQLRLSVLPASSPVITLLLLLLLLLVVVWFGLV